MNASPEERSSLVAVLGEPGVYFVHDQAIISSLEIGDGWVRFQISGGVAYWAEPGQSTLVPHDAPSGSVHAGTRSSAAGPKAAIARRARWLAQWQDAQTPILIVGAPGKDWRLSSLDAAISLSCGPVAG